MRRNVFRIDRLSALITSQSSAGKSTLVNGILQPFSEHVLDFTDYTPAYLNRTGLDMNGKIFKMEQMERTNEKNQVTLHNLKFLLTEGKLKIGLVDRNEKGKNVPKTLEVNGIPVFLSTSTNYSIDPETQNRLFLMQVDESEGQTKQVVSHILSKYQTLGINDKWSQNLEQLKEIAETYREFSHQIRGVYIPFADKIQEIIPTSDLTIRRDLSKILNLACVIAFLHFPQRTLIANNAGENFIVDMWSTEKRYTYYLIVEPADFKEALEIGGETIQQTINKLNKSSMEIYQLVLKLYADNPGGITVNDVATETKLSTNRARELLKQLLDAGFLTRDKDGREYKYHPTQKKFQNISIDKIEFTKYDLEEWMKTQLGENQQKFTVLNRSVRDIVLYQKPQN